MCRLPSGKSTSHIRPQSAGVDLVHGGVGGGGGGGVGGGGCGGFGGGGCVVTEACFQADELTLFGLAREAQ